MGAVNMYCQQVIPSNPGGPAGVELSNDTAIQNESAVCCIFCRTFIGLSVFIHPFRDVGSTEAGNRVYLPEQIFQQVLPVA